MFASALELGREAPRIARGRHPRARYATTGAAVAGPRRVDAPDLPSAPRLPACQIAAEPPAPVTSNLSFSSFELQRLRKFGKTYSSGIIGDGPCRGAAQQAIADGSSVDSAPSSEEWLRVACEGLGDQFKHCLLISDGLWASF